jgi:hypothetical protein
MAFRLIVTRPNGTEFQTSAEPLSDRETVGISALRALAANGIAFTRKDMAFGRQVRDAEIGETVEHASTGYAFRTEEF